MILNSFVFKCLFLYGPFCHCALKLDLSTLFTTFFFEHLVNYRDVKCDDVITCLWHYGRFPLISSIFIGYWLDMEIYVLVLVRSNIARRQERNINYAPERVHIFPYPTNNLFITYALLSQKA